MQVTDYNPPGCGIGGFPPIVERATGLMGMTGKTATGSKGLTEIPETRVTARTEMTSVRPLACGQLLSRTVTPVQFRASPLGPSPISAMWCGVDSFIGFYPRPESETDLCQCRTRPGALLQSDPLGVAMSSVANSGCSSAPSIRHSRGASPRTCVTPTVAVEAQAKRILRTRPFTYRHSAPLFHPQAVAVGLAGLGLFSTSFCDSLATTNSTRPGPAYLKKDKP